MKCYVCHSCTLLSGSTTFSCSIFCINTLLFQQKLAKFRNVYQEAIGRRERKKKPRVEGNIKIYKIKS